MMKQMLMMLVVLALVSSVSAAPASPLLPTVVSVAGYSSANIAVPVGAGVPFEVSCNAVTKAGVTNLKGRGSVTFAAGQCGPNSVATVSMSGVLGQSAPVVSSLSKMNLLELKAFNVCQ